MHAVLSAQKFQFQFCKSEEKRRSKLNFCLFPPSVDHSNAGGVSTDHVESTPSTVNEKSLETHVSSREKSREMHRSTGSLCMSKSSGSTE